MAQQSNIQERKRELVSHIGQIRANLASERAEIANRLHPVKRLSSGIKNSPIRVFGLTFTLTALATLLFRRKPKPAKVEKKRVQAGGILASTLLGIAQPFVKKWLIEILQRKHNDRLNPTSRDSLLGP